MENDNEFDEESDVPGRSVFGDDAPLGDDESPTVSIDEGTSVFGDDVADGGASVFADADSDDGQLSLTGDEPGNSVFASDGTASLDDDPWAAASDVDQVEIPSQSEVILGSAGASSLSAPDVPDEIELQDEVVDASAPREITLDAWSTPDAADGPAPDVETVALDVEPTGEDDLDAWSDLSGPVWSAEDAEAGSREDWDPGPAPDEPEVVQIGDPGEQFFAYDDDGGFADDFIDDSSGPGNMQARIITGVALLVVGLIALSLGPRIALALIVVIVALCAGEFFNAVRVAGYQPATLLGLAASVAMPIAVFVRGPQAIGLVLALSVVFGLLWFLLGVGTELPVMNIGVTLLGIIYVGVLGSFGAAILEIGDRARVTGSDGEGVGLLLAAIVITVGYDVGAFFAGRSMGRTPLTAVSPNKTVEGLIGGAFTSAVAAFVVFGLVQFVEPFESVGTGFNALFLGLLGAVVAPLGDLGESLIKRDLGIKDMGSVLPGHGGFLDRFDALLFVLPAVYFFAELVFY